MIDKDYCLSSFLAFRYVFNNDMHFFKDIERQKYIPIPADEKTPVSDACETDLAINNIFHLISNEKLGILLSGGMDSACLAAYMPEGSDAYTFRFLGGKYQTQELERARQYADFYKLKLHYIDINWNIVKESIIPVIKQKGAPVHSIEPQLYYAAQESKKDGVTMLIIGDGADYVFGGMDGLLSKDWTFDQYVTRNFYVNPTNILVNPVDVTSVFEPYRIGNNSIDWLRFYNEQITYESYASYKNAFKAADMPYMDPYERLKFTKPIDIERIRKGESKYVVRELFKMKYPDFEIPSKLPMPRPVDDYFKYWEGPKRPEFRRDIRMDTLTGNQKWLLWCAELFLNLYD